MTKTENQTQFGQRIADERVFGCAKAFYCRAAAGSPRSTATFTSRQSRPSTKHVVRKSGLPHDLWFDGGN